MDFIQFFSLLITLISMFLWNRSEARSDVRHMDAKLDLYRQESNAMIRAIQEEIKDFHKRLCSIEERNKK